MKLRTEWMTRLAARVGSVAMAMMLLVFGLAAIGAENGALHDGGRSPQDGAGPDRGKSQSGKIGRAHV